MRPKIRDVIDDIIDGLYSKRLDEAFEMGIREGSRRALSSAKIRIEMRANSLTPARKVGAEMAVSTIEEEQEQWKRR
jgi:hypothetical protein